MLQVRQKQPMTMALPSAIGAVDETTTQIPDRAVGQRMRDQTRERVALMRIVEVQTLAAQGIVEELQDNVMRSVQRSLRTSLELRADVLPDDEYQAEFEDFVAAVNNAALKHSRLRFETTHDRITEIAQRSPEPPPEAPRRRGIFSWL